MDGTLEKSEKNINAGQNTSEIAAWAYLALAGRFLSTYIEKLSITKKRGILKALENGVLTDDPFEQV